MAKKQNSGKKRAKGMPLDGVAVSALRKSLGLTQEELATRIDADVKTIGRIEAGESTTYLRALAKALDVHPTQLMKDAPESIRPPEGTKETERMRFSLILDVPPSWVEVFKREPNAAKLWLYCKLQGLMKDGAENIDVKIGSIIVSAHLTKRDIAQLTKAFMDGELDLLSVTGIECKTIPVDAEGVERPNAIGGDVEPSVTLLTEMVRQLPLMREASEYDYARFAHTIAMVAWTASDQPIYFAKHYDGAGDVTALWFMIPTDRKLLIRFRWLPSLSMKMLLEQDGFSQRAAATMGVEWEKGGERCKNIEEVLKFIDDILEQRESLRAWMEGVLAAEKAMRTTE